MNEQFLIERFVRDYLAAALSVPVKLERTDTDPAALVVLEKTGSDPLAPGIRDATIAAQSYGGSMYAAAQLDAAVIAAMSDIDAQPEISACALSTDGNFTNTADKRYRYQAVFYLTYYEQE